jgi:hypothetical protein
MAFDVDKRDYMVENNLEVLVEDIPVVVVDNLVVEDTVIDRKIVVVDLFKIFYKIHNYSCVNMFSLSLKNK